MLVPLLGLTRKNSRRESRTWNLALEEGGKEEGGREGGSGEMSGELMKQKTCTVYVGGKSRRKKDG